MQAIEYFEVECPETVGGALYKRLAEVVLLDHDLLKVLAKVHFRIDPQVPIFIAVGVLKRLPGPVRARDFADVNVQERKATISIGNETYLAAFLTRLWDRFGKERVDQPDRFTIVIEGDAKELEDIADMIVTDPSEALYKDLIYALQVIQPEGFKVRRQFYGKGKFWFVASENTIREDILIEIDELFAKMGESR